MKYFIFLIIITQNIFAITLDEIIIKSLDNNPSLTSINHRLEASDSNINISTEFSNPILTYTQNTIDSSEPMNQKTISIQQKLPYFGKRDSLKDVAYAKKNILIENLEQAKVILVQSIKNQAYTIWELEKLYSIIDEYINITKQNIELFESYTSSSDDQHMGIMSAELTLVDLKIQKSTLKAKILSAYSKLSYLASFQVDNLKIDLILGAIPSKESLHVELYNNHDIAIKDKIIQKNKALVKNADLDSYPDFKLIGGYSSRENFDDYFTFGIGLTLPIYNTQTYKQERAKALVLSAKSLKQDAKLALNSEFDTVYAQMKSAYDIYHLVHDEALPQIEHMFELTNSSIATGGDLFKYINILVQKLRLEQKSIMAISSYKRAEAKISALRGEIQ